MRRRTFALAAAALIGAGLLAITPQNKATAATSAGDSSLSAQAQKVVDYLLEDWGKRFRSTSIPLAMSNLGMDPDDALRLEIGKHFRANTDLANNLKWWGANNYILSNDEKLIAKYLLNTFRDENRLPGLDELAEATVLSPDQTARRLGFLADAGLLTPASGEDLGYALAEGHKRWGGPLQHNFHTVAIEGEKPFDVW